MKVIIADFLASVRALETRSFDRIGTAHDATMRRDGNRVNRGATERGRTPTGCAGAGPAWGGRRGGWHSNHDDDVVERAAAKCAWPPTPRKAVRQRRHLSP
jgi:hypothetical protein